MKGKENGNVITKLSIKDRIAIFDKNKKNVQPNIYSKKNNKLENKNKEYLNPIEKKTQLYEPKKTQEYKFKKNEPKYVQHGNNNITVYSSSNNNTNDLEKNKKLNQNDKNAKYYNSNTANINKNSLKFKEKINKFNYNDKTISNKDKNNINKSFKKTQEINNKNNFIKDTNELQNKTTPKIYKFENSQNLNKNPKKEEQKHINNNEKCSKNILDRIAIFDKNISKENKIQKFNKKENQDKNNTRINNFNNQKYNNNNYTNNFNNNNYNHNNIKNNINKNNNFIEKQKEKKEFNKIIETNSNKKEKINNQENQENIVLNTSPNNIIPEKKIENVIINNQNDIKEIPKLINQNDILPRNNIKEDVGIPKEKNENVVRKMRFSKSQPKYKLKNDIVNLNNNINDYIKDYALLNEIPINEEEKTNSFCKAFLIVSIPKTNNKIMEKTEGIPADCGHVECSSLPSFEPEIIYKYPEKDSKDLELNNILASICFPNSIKVCYSTQEDTITTKKNYRSCFTNQVGDRYYSMMYHFYIKMPNTDFYNNYNSKLIEHISIRYSNELNEDIESKTKLLNEINKRNYVYIPYGLCLVSKYPHFGQMELCLQSIMLTIKNNDLKNNELNEIITYLVKSIPSPYVNTSIVFPMANSKHMIELRPPLYQEFSLYGDNIFHLLDKLTENNFILLFRLLLFEQKILLISDDYNNLTQFSLNLLSLLYPFTWIHIYIPIITEKMLKYLQSFLPFINGINRSLYEKENVLNLIISSQKDLYIYDIDKNILEISCNLYAKKKENITKIMNKSIPSLPKKIENIIRQQLYILKSDLKKKSINENNYNIRLKLIFIQVFIELFYDYKHFLTIIDDLPIFNIKAFLKDKSELDKNFYKELMATQLFQIFIQNSSNYLNNKNEKYFFDELISEYLLHKKDNKKYYIINHNVFEKNMINNLYNIKKEYIIQPCKLKLLFYRPIVVEGKINSKTAQKVIEHLNLHLKEVFRDYPNLNENGIIKENKRIINNNEFFISNKNDIKEIKYYLTDEEINENEKNIDNKKINKNDLDRDGDGGLDEYGITEIEKEDIKDNIRIGLKHAFKSEKLNINDEINSLLSSLDNEFGLNYFIDIFEINRFNEETKIISDDTFQILLEIISKSLLKFTTSEKHMMNAIRLIKTCYYFKTIVNKNTYLLNEKIFEILTINYKLFKEILFWELWVENELDENEIKILNEIKEINEDKDNFHYFDEDEEENAKFKEKYKTELKNARKNMEIIKLNKSFIITVIESLCDKYLSDDEFKIQQVTEIMNKNNKIINNMQ